MENYRLLIKNQVLTNFGEVMGYDLKGMVITDIKNLHTCNKFEDILIHKDMAISDGAYIAHTTANSVILGHNELIVNLNEREKIRNLLLAISKIAYGSN